MCEDIGSFEADYGTEDICPAGTEGHEPNWNTVTVTSDGGQLYLDVSCKNCGRSGCIDTLNYLATTISW